MLSDILPIFTPDGFHLGTLSFQPNAVGLERGGDRVWWTRNKPGH